MRKKLKLRLKKRSGLFAPGARLVVKEGNKTYTERVSLSIVNITQNREDEPFNCEKTQREKQTNTERVSLSIVKMVAAAMHIYRLQCSFSL